MSIQKLDWYDSTGRLRTYEAWRIYAIFCLRTSSDALVKIGVSSVIYQRLLALQTGMPFPMGVCLHAHIGERGPTMAFEAALHRAFSERNTRGEWFSFDLSSATDKRVFHDTVRGVFEGMFLGELKWDKITPDQLAAYASLKQKEISDKRVKRPKRPRWALPRPPGA